MLKMRTIKEAYRTILRDDPHTALTLCAIRRLVNEGTIPSIRVGRKILLNLDALIAYLSTSAHVATTNNRGQIRRVS